MRQCPLERADMTRLRALPRGVRGASPSLCTTVERTRLSALVAHELTHLDDARDGLHLRAERVEVALPGERSVEAELFVTAGDQGVAGVEIVSGPDGLLNRLQDL